MTGHRSRTLAAAVPLVLVNVVAFSGQLAFLRSHLHWPLAGQVVMAVALESVAVFLAFHAHVAALANDSALRLRLSSYAFAAVIGIMNYSHYALPGWRPTFPAVAVGLMSVSSPWLWAVHSRRVSRDALMARGLVESHALRLGATRWLWHPARSARVMWLATWDGISDPREALDRFGNRNARQPGTGPGEAAGTGSQSGPRTGPELPAGGDPEPAREVAAEPVRQALPGPVQDGHGEPVRPPRANRSGRRSASRSARPVSTEDAEQEFAPEIASGSVPSLYQIRSRLHVGNNRAKVLRQHLARQALST